MPAAFLERNLAGTRIVVTGFVLLGGSAFQEEQEHRTARISDDVTDEIDVAEFSTVSGTAS